jgi:hypothetical protein
MEQQNTRISRDDFMNKQKKKPISYKEVMHHKEDALLEFIKKNEEDKKGEIDEKKR